MVAGRALDALVAEMVMGRKWMTYIHQAYLLTPEVVPEICYRGSSWTEGKTAAWDSECRILSDLTGQRVPDYSTDMRAAFEVVGKMLEREWWMFDLRSVSPGEGVVDFCNTINPALTRDSASRFKTVDEVPAAICNAALKAIVAK